MNRNSKSFEFRSADPGDHELCEVAQALNNVESVFVEPPEIVAPPKRPRRQISNAGLYEDRMGRFVVKYLLQCLGGK